MSTINEIQDEIIDEFGMFDDWTDKYAYIIELGKKLPLIDPIYKIDEKKIKGCQSTVWLHSELKEGKVSYTADSDAVIVKGIVSLLIRVLNNQTPTDVTSSNLYFIDKIGIQQHLSITRSNGLTSMLKQMKLDAIALGSL